MDNSLNANPRIRIVLQVRSTSKRLPMKALLPVGGVPSFVLSAKRLSTSGRDVYVATSSDSSDDIIQSIAWKNGLHLTRGPLENVFERFLLSTADMENGDICVRATADNMIPDGSLVEKTLEHFISVDRRYLSSKEVVSEDLPHGVVVEAFQLSIMREAKAFGGMTKFEQEHVTPKIIKLDGGVPGSTKVKEDKRLPSLSIDDEISYRRVERLFSDCRDPAEDPWDFLVRKASTI